MFPWTSTDPRSKDSAILSNTAVTLIDVHAYVLEGYRTEFEQATIENLTWKQLLKNRDGGRHGLKELQVLGNYRSDTPDDKNDDAVVMSECLCLISFSIRYLFENRNALVLINLFLRTFEDPLSQIVICSNITWTHLPRLLRYVIVGEILASSVEPTRPVERHAIFASVPVYQKIASYTNVSGTALLWRFYRFETLFIKGLCKGLLYELSRLPYGNCKQWTAIWTVSSLLLVYLLTMFSIIKMQT